MMHHGDKEIEMESLMLGTIGAGAASQSTSKNLVSRTRTSHGKNNSNTARTSFKHIRIFIALAGTIATILFFYDRYGREVNILNVVHSTISSSHKSGASSLPHLSCPSSEVVGSAKNDNYSSGEQTVSEFYEKGQTAAMKKTTSLTLEDIEELKFKNYDGWSRDFYKFKDSKIDWKTRMFSSLESGDTIFESACGRGFNLLMTVEILKEELGIENISVYGIDYVESSVLLANEILSTALKAIGSQLGSPICRGDATNLFFVPDESFDLVFTGYIDPIVDPLDIKSELGRQFEYEDICDMTDPKDWAYATLAKLDQKAQEDWYAAWVNELVRIAKKGSPVVIEEISYELCDSQDWGGVSEIWWTEAIETYNWAIDKDSIHIEPTKSTDERYNLFMRKNR